MWFLLRHTVSIVLFFCLVLPVFATTNVVKIGLFWGNEPTDALISAAAGSYEIIADGKKIMDLGGEGGQRMVIMTAVGRQIRLKTLKDPIGTYNRVQFKRTSWNCNIRIKASKPKAHAAKVFYGNLSVRSIGRLRMINEVYLEHYIAGVVESEAGSKEPLEYYKVQSIICRTYALSNIRRHSGQGFHLCDKVHCQVYHRKSTANPDIIKGVNETKGTVIVDSDIELITAAFSSNCGGETNNSEDVWTNPVSYLRTVPDTFCTDHNHAHWERDIAVQDWLKYLQRRFRYPVEDSASYANAVSFCPEHRQFFLTKTQPHIPLKKVRMDWKFPSAFFNIKQEGDTLHFTGKGYGHGVGLCQEGAMRMAEKGLPYNEILHHYYTDVHLINLAVIDFFRSE